MCQEYSSINKYTVIVNGAIFNNFDTDGTPYTASSLHRDHLHRFHDMFDSIASK